MSPAHTSPANANVNVRPIGIVRSPLTDAELAPLQGDEGAPAARLVLEADVTAGLAGLRPGDELFVLTWLHRAARDVLSVHPRGDRTRPRQGVFATRSPDRPNPIGLHRVPVLAVHADGLEVGELEAVDGTPVLDIKPVLSAGGR